MSRDFQIQGPSLVKIAFGGHWEGTPLSPLSGVVELGLTSEPIKVEYVRNYEDIVPNDFGKAPADVSYQLGECRVRMTLIHFDALVLRACMSDSMGGAGEREVVNTPAQKSFNVFPGNYGTAAGRLLGHGLPRFASGNYFVGLNVRGGPDAESIHHRFFYCYLSEQPVVYPLGTQSSAVELTWRAVPYQPVWWSGNLVDDDRVKLINEGTNNGPKWENQFLFTGQLDTLVTYTLVKEPLASGAQLWDNGYDG